MKVFSGCHPNKTFLFESSDEKARSTRNSPGSFGGFGKRGNFCLPPKRCRWFPISEIWKDTEDTDTYIEDKFQIWMIRLRLPGISPKPLKSTHVWWSIFSQDVQLCTSKLRTSRVVALEPVNFISLVILRLWPLWDEENVTWTQRLLVTSNVWG